MTNPLLKNAVLPLFSAIKAEHVEPAVDTLLDDCRNHLQRVLKANSSGNISWKSLVAPLEEQDDRLNKAWSPVGHMNAVVNSEPLREAYSHSLAKLTAYSTEVGQNQELYQAYRTLAEGAEFTRLTGPQQTAIEHALRDFTLAGVALTELDQQTFTRIKQRLSELSTEFSNHVLDATQGWYKHIIQVEELAGMPENAIALAAQAAQQKGLEGYVLTLDIPAYLAVMMHADKRELRQEIYTAYATRASDTGPTAGQWDNTPLMDEILCLRHQLAQLLGFANYAERSLATKMAENCDQVEDFLVELAKKSRPVAEKEWSQLQGFARQCDGTDDLQAWDQAYYSEKLKQKTYAISQEELRPYFPARKVVSGLFAVVKKLFGIEVSEAQAQCWHSDVQFFDITHEGELIAHFYLDLYARANKRGGAWMDECRVRRLGVHMDGQPHLQRPVAYLTCNFTPALGDDPALLTHNEVVTLFHEFGHGLHHMLTRITTASVSGINGVAWDAVELPSQFLENWCWQKAIIPMISGHYQSGEPLPESLLNNLLAAKNFQSALQMLRQIEFSLFDFRLHRNYVDPDDLDRKDHEQQPQLVQAVLNQVRKQVAVIVPPAFNRFQNGFSHIFAGGYAAGYYSYKWAEVLSSDAFSRFEDEGIFNEKTGKSFLSEILQCGGSEDAMTLFKRFRGREPNTEALLRHSGITRSIK